MLKFLPNKNDDKNFVELIERIVNSIIELIQPKDVFITKVDHWFDFKWREFSHKIFGALGVWREPLRIPPFIPDRIIEESYYETSGQSYERKNLYQLHIYQTSSENAVRKIRRESAVYMWYSGETVKNSQGSLMVYTFNEDFQNSWYVSFIRKAEWQIYKTDNVSKAEIRSMIENDYLALIR